MKVVCAGEKGAMEGVGGWEKNLESEVVGNRENRLEMEVVGDWAVRFDGSCGLLGKQKYC